MKIVFMGTPDFAVPCLTSLVEAGYEVTAVVTQPDRPKGRKKELTPPPVKQAALALGIPVLQPERLRSEEEVERIRQLKPDLIVTAAYGQILPKSIIELPAYGCINVHASLLPQYRGGAPIHKAIIDGKKETGVTIMYMVEKLDAGDILTQVTVPIGEKDTVGTMHDKLSAAGSKLLIETIPQIIEGTITPIKQDESSVTYAWNITREDEKINWSRTAREIYNQIRGLNPWPVSFTTLQGEVFKIWWSEISDESMNAREPGTIIQVQEQGVEVACGQGILRLLEVQPAGKKKMPVRDYIHGAGACLKPGMKFE